MKQAYNRTSEEIIREFASSIDGLDQAQVEVSRSEHGSNTLGDEKRVSKLMVFLMQFNDFLIWILLAAAVLSLILAKAESAIVIAVVVLVNAILGTVQHLKAEESLSALKALSSPSAKVIRSGETLTINSQELVVGDILLLETGDFIAADGRIISEHSLKADESALTGESVSSEKDSETLTGADLAPGDQSNMVFSGTHITYGRGLAIVTAVGKSTELGKIASMLEQAKEKKTPLQISLDSFGRKLAVIILAISAVIFALSIYRGRPMPADGLDLTDPLDSRLLRIAMLCNDSITTDNGEIGDPTELALVDWGEVYELDELKLRQQFGRLSELPFDSERKLMSTLHEIDGSNIMMAKGGVDVMLKRVDHIDEGSGVRPITADDISRIEQVNHKLSSEGLRVLAFAAKTHDNEHLEPDDEQGLVFMRSP